MLDDDTETPAETIQPSQIDPWGTLDIITNAPIGIFQSTPEGRFVSVNPALAKMYGYETPEELVESITDFDKQLYADPADRKIFKHLIAIHGKVVNYEYRLRRRDGSVYWVSTNARAIRDKDGNITHYQGFTTDIDNRKKAENALRSSERKYRQLFENSPISLWEQDFSIVKQHIDTIKYQNTGDLRAVLKERPDLVSELAAMVRVVDVNQSTLKLYTADSREVLFGNVAALYSREYCENFIDILLGVAHGKSTFFAETKHRTLEGKHKDIQIYWAVVPGYEETYSRVIVSIVDISAQKQAEQRYQALVENLNEVIYTLDEKANITYVSPRIEPLSGYSSNEIIGRNFIEFVHPEDLEGRLEHYEKVKSGSAEPSEYRFIDKNGESVWIRTSARPVIENNRVIGIQGALNVVTELKQAETEKNFQLRFQKVISEIAADFASVVSEPGFNRALDETLGRLGCLFNMDRAYVFSFSDDMAFITNTHEWCANGAIPQKERLQHYPTDDLPWWRERIQQLEPVHIPDVEALPPQAVLEKAHFRTHGIRALLHLPLVSTQGKLSGFMGFDAMNRTHCWPDDQVVMIGVVAKIIGNVIERKRVADALEQALEQRRILLDNIQTQVWYFTGDHTYGAVNKAHAAFNGVRPADIAFRDMRDIYPETVVNAYCSDNADVFSSGVPVFTEEWIPNASSEPRLLSICKTPGFKSDGTVGYIVCSAEDITDRRRVEKEQKQLQERLLYAQKLESVGILTGGMAHEFNNKLFIINGYAEMALSDTTPQDPNHLRIKEIMKAGRKSSDLVQQLMAFARQQTASPMEIDLNKIISGMIPVHQNLMKKGVELFYKPGDFSWHVTMDPIQVHQILTNLCTNANDAIRDSGRIVVETGAACFDADDCAGNAEVMFGEFVMIAVSDNGCGIDESIRNKIFDPFFTTKGVARGTGLGLSSVYGIVRQNDGFINVTSEPGKGTTFRIYLPRHKPNRSS